ncbi:DUF3846 domain-containing protein [Collinsella sp. AF38-3AC]|uniref:DUF3846 domain-containing protein n=1 Tax=Collinsella sp. AF38-3AC TaxID=2292015 RepID=UPI00131478DE|nr:DUF3846 domain-containing protein [Collinsella sp. AF38-3AC]
MGSQITKIPSICGDQYPGIGYQVDCGESVRVAMAWPSASAGGWRSLTMEVPKKLSLETELNGVSVETLLKAAGELFEDNDLDGFRQFEQMLGDKLPSTVVRLFVRYAPIDLTHAGNAEVCRAEIEEFLGEHVPSLDTVETEIASGKNRAVLVPVGFDPVAVEIGSGQEVMNLVGGLFDEASGSLPPDALPFNLSMYVNDEGLYTCQPNRAFYATERMEQEGYYSAIDGKPVVASLPTSVLYGNIVVTGFNPATGEDAPLSVGEMMDVMNYFQRDSPRDSGREVALIVQNGLYGELRESLSQESSSHEDKTLDSATESLDEMMEQKVEAADGSELGEDLGVSNGER